LFFYYELDYIEAKTYLIDFIKVASGMFPILQTERLSLRQVIRSDADNLYLWLSNNEITQHLDWNGPQSIEQTKALIDSWKLQYESNKLYTWGIYQNGDNQIIGTVMLMPLRGTFEQEPLYPLTIGFDLARDYWNRGIMTETLEAVIRYVRENISVHRIQAEVSPNNLASIKLLRKMGFAEEGLLKQYLLHENTKEFMDVVLFALLLNQ
jgi:ribosomal-protein-alanine N-acetyltransferase